MLRQFIVTQPKNVRNFATKIKEDLKPSEVVKILNNHIVGQDQAKRAVSIALRNRWRRRQCDEEVRKEIMPRNVLMIGPTGCGKTEIARRMALLDKSPFLKVEATKFTEVGYHGRDVDSIVRDLMDVSFQLTRSLHMERVRSEAQARVESKILDLLMGPELVTSAHSSNVVKDGDEDDAESKEALKRAIVGDGDKAVTNVKDTYDKIKSSTRDKFVNLYRAGLLDEQEVSLEIPQEYLDKNSGTAGGQGGMFGMDASSLPQNISHVMTFLSKGGGKEGVKKKKKMKIAEARIVLEEMEVDGLLEGVDLKSEAVKRAEESGIVFLDEIDKICSPKDAYRSGADASAEGVQRDLLPLVEGTTINTKYGNVKTDYMLFIGSGAFHQCKPSDLLPELQGRLPIRVELAELTETHLYQILTEPVTNLIKQQQALIETEGVTLKFDEDALKEIARMAAFLNRTVENIGARRLHTVIERIMEEISYEVADYDDDMKEYVVTKELVEERLKDFIKDPDLGKYIL